MAPPPEHDPHGDETTLRVERIVPGGDGLARRPDGCVVFIPRTAPGDVVEVDYTEERRNWRRARVKRLIEPGGDRQTPPCDYYDRCGGCQFQHLDYQSQLRVKTGIVLDCLRRLGGVELPHLDIEHSPKPLAYRNKITLALRGDPSGPRAGYHGADDPDAIVDVAECPLAEDPINEVWRSLRADLPGLTRPGQRDARLTLRATTGGQVGLLVESPPGGIDVSRDVVNVAGLDVIWWTDHKGRMVAEAGSRQLREGWGPFEFLLTGTSFLQVNREAAAVMDDYIRAQCAGDQGRTVVDAYCGFGLRALELARQGARVTAVDIDAGSVEVGSRLASDHGIAVRFVAGAVERVLKSLLPACTVILNPPRRGVARPVLKALTTQPPDRIVYVSCDPATLSRDLKGLGSRFQLTACRAFDLFPQTAHVETVVTLDRTGPRAR
jgi:23S rRNA (uracil1939-C5)-methyltransferase